MDSAVLIRACRFQYIINMTEIKSALEIALERTSEIKDDKQTLTANERKQEGKRLASKFLAPAAEDAPDPSSEFKRYSRDEAPYVREGFLETILANLSLPNDGDYKERLTQLEKALQFIVKDKRQLSYLFQQVDQFFEQYLQTKQQVEEQLKQQYEPQLREKERALAQQMGAQIQLKPESDPEFMNLLSKNLTRLEEQYNQALGQVKDELTRIARIKR